MINKKILALIFFSLVYFSAIAQVNTENDIYNYFYKEKFDEVLKIYNGLDENGKMNLSDSAIYMVAFTYFVQDDCESAIKLHNELINRKPDSPNSYYYISRCYLKMNKPDDALRFIDKAIEISDDKILYKIEKGRLLRDLKSYKESETVFKELIEVDKINLPEVNYYYGVTLMGLKKYNEAGEQFLKNIENQTEDSEFITLSKINLGIIENVSNNFARSNQFLTPFLNTEFESGQILSFIIQNYNGLMKFDSANYVAGKLYELHKKLNGKEKTFYFYSKETDSLIVEGVEELMDPDPDKKYPFYKNIFSFYDGDGKFLYSVQAELLFGTGGEIPPVFVMGWSKYEGDKYHHKTFGTLNSKYPLNYRFLFESLKKILNNEVNPTSSSIKTIKDK